MEVSLQQQQRPTFRPKSAVRFIDPPLPAQRPGSTRTTYHQPAAAAALNQLTPHFSRTYYHVQMILEWVFVLTNLVLETLSAFFDQIASPKRPQYALVAMLLSFTALLICILGLLYRAHKEGAVWRTFWFFHRSPPNKPLGDFADNFSFICAVAQCFSSVIQYVFYSDHADNPAKLSFFPFMLALAFLYLQCTKTRNLPTLGLQF